jgi:hypothetical protein
VSVAVIALISLAQTRSAPAVRGRIMALLAMALASTQPLSYAVGPRGIILLGGAGIAPAGLLGPARPAMRVAG